jgi:hypothetical protein
VRRLDKPMAGPDLVKAGTSSSLKARSASARRLWVLNSYTEARASSTNRALLLSSRFRQTNSCATAVRVRVALEMPQRGHSAQTRAGVLLHEQGSELAEREIREKQQDSAVYIAILLWHRACHRFSASSGSKTEWGHFTEFNNLPTRCLHTVAQAWMGLLLGKLR